MLDSRLIKQTTRDPCLHVHANSEWEMFVVAVHINDIIFGGKNKSILNQVKQKLSKKLDFKDLGSLHHFLGVTVILDQLSENIPIGQPNEPMYTEKILHNFDMILSWLVCL